jgi:prevent-host-death family protein
MSRPVLTITEVNQNFSKAIAAAERGEVVITQRGRPRYVLLRYETYARLAQPAPKVSLLETLYEPGLDEIELELPARRAEPFPRGGQSVDGAGG